MMEINKKFVFNVSLLLIIIFLDILFLMRQHYRYIKYFSIFVPLILCIPFLFSKNKKFHPLILKYIIGYSIIIFLTSIFNIDQVSSFRYFANVVFILLPLVSLFFLFIIDLRIDKAKILDIIYYVFVVIYIWQILSIFNFNLIKMFVDSIKYAVFPSAIGTPTFLATFFALYAIYNLDKKGYKFLVFNFILILISLKRILVIAILFAVVFYYISKRWHYILRYKKIFITAAIILNIFYIFIGGLLASGMAGGFLHDTFGLSANHFTMGRQSLYNFAYSEFPGFPLMGMGLGRTDDLLYAEMGWGERLHSDIIKNYFEFGPFLFVFWLYFLYNNSFSTRRSITLTIFANVFFLTSNIFIYVSLMFFYYLFVILEYNSTFRSQKFKTGNKRKNENPTST